jgi:hypothetical protein
VAAGHGEPVVTADSSSDNLNLIGIQDASTSIVRIEAVRDLVLRAAGVRGSDKQFTKHNQTPV